jgi:DNA polymerase elongation subunit (family B)
VTAPRVLLFDIENTPNIAYTWGKWQQDVRKFEREWWMLCYGYKWLGERKTHVVAQPDFSGYTRDRTNDRQLVKSLRDLIDEADVVIAHNGDKFDLPKARARWAVHGIDPPSPVKSVDTLKVARRYFMFNSNSLGDLGETLGLGSKGETGGFDTWLDCMAGDPKAWARMIRYCGKDVDLLEAVYLRLRPFIENGHPNMSLMSDKPDACCRCGSDRGMKSHGWRYYGVTKRRRFRCRDCAAFCYGRTVVKPDSLYVS